MHLVVLDDNEAVANLMATIARELGWTAQAVTEEATFQALVQAGPPDAIMLDLQLGVSDGIEQLRFLDSEGYRGAVVLMSGFDTRVLASAQRVGNSLGLKIAAALEKPTAVTEVRDVLAAIEDAPTAGAERPIDDRPELRLLAAADVARAFDAGLMELHLQPIVAAAGHSVTSAEGLIRWRDPALGLLLPDQFIPIAETDQKLIDRLTMWVVETGLSHHRALAALGHDIQVCINISGRNLRALDFPDRMAAMLQRMSLAPGAIGLEITESVAMHDLDHITAILTQLRLKGFAIAIDDFGTGHSSLTALSHMPFSSIKIDKSFVEELQTSTDALKIVRSVIQLARDMHLPCVAEGVDSVCSARLLTELGIDGLQGFYFSPPLPVEGFATWLDKWTRLGRAAALVEPGVPGLGHVFP